ncbi:SRPBCC domain-containing protein [Modestobacter sp. VKM Ac-2979]|uniref:CoxG family protein n=1 Tax=unclassified Modestobacter TaxID=2643866 RepID=UPI0022AB6D93|nr:MULTISPECIES: SRPBCC domain-containing protein [unclassified Modestobacter]MCZ2813928.1 SRPBCC domain-containing protein [Modestobacter sp. VKM Ac-2979]MCZ2844657.1 SRPBCC domain-containing protein [Modestobacter sp. VKM Ac-2980]
MASEQFARELVVASAPERCWAVLTDVAEVASWVTIAYDVKEIERLAAYTAVLQDKLGPFKLRALLHISVEVLDDGRQVRMRASGKDVQINSQITVDATLSLRRTDEGGTVVATEGTYQVVGRVATMGAGTIRKKADKILEEFFSNAARELQARV